MNNLIFSFGLDLMQGSFSNQFDIHMRTYIQKEKKLIVIICFRKFLRVENVHFVLD